MCIEVDSLRWWQLLFAEFHVCQMQTRQTTLNYPAVLHLNRLVSQARKVPPQVRSHIMAVISLADLWFIATTIDRLARA